MSVSRIQPASVIDSGASLAGTCLTQTTIFIDVFSSRTGLQPVAFCPKLPALPEQPALGHREPRQAVSLSYSAQRLKSNAALVPPKPKEFESACCTAALRM